MINKIFNNKYTIALIGLIVLYNNFSYKGKSISLLTEYAINYNKDFMIKNENCSEELGELSLPLRWVVRNHKRTYAYKRDIVLIFLKQYNCQFSKYGQSYELEGSPFFGYELADAFGKILKEHKNHSMGLTTTVEAYSIIGEIEDLECDELIKKELNITYILYQQRGMKIEKYPNCLVLPSQ